MEIAVESEQFGFREATNSSRRSRSTHEETSIVWQKRTMKGTKGEYRMDLRG